MIFTALSGHTESTRWLGGVLTFAGRQDTVAVRHDLRHRSASGSSLPR